MPGASDATLQDPQLEELKNKFLGSNGRSAPGIG